MSTGLLIGLFCVYFLHLAADNDPLRRSTLSSSAIHELLIHGQLKNLDFVFLLITLYYIPNLSGTWYPGADWTDPKLGEGRPQLFLFPLVLFVSWRAWRTEKKNVVMAHSSALPGKEA